MIPGFHTAALGEHDLASAGAILRQIGFGAIAVRLSLARLDPLADSSLRSVQMATMATGRRELELVVDADGPYLIDPWASAIPSLFEPGESRRRRLDYLVAAVEMVGELGGGVVTFSVGALPDAMETQGALDCLADAVLSVATVAEQVGVKIAVRPRGGHFVDSVGRFERLVRWTGENPQMLLAADVATMVAGGEMPVVDLLARVRSRLAVVYLSEARFPAGGEPLVGLGSVSVSRVVRGLVAEGYAGLVLVEPAGHGVSPEDAQSYFQAVFAD